MPLLAELVPHCGECKERINKQKMAVTQIFNRKFHEMDKEPLVSPAAGPICKFSTVFYPTLPKIAMAAPAAGCNRLKYLNRVVSEYKKG